MATLSKNGKNKLDKLMIRKYKLDLKVVLADDYASFPIMMIFYFLLMINPPPFFYFLIKNYGVNNFLLFAFLVVILPVLINIIITLILNYAKKSWRIKKNDEGMKAISSLAFCEVPILLFCYFPSNLSELFWWIITIFGLYIGFWKERAPLIQYAVDLYYIERNRFNSSMEHISRFEPSLGVLILTLLTVILLAFLNIYPVPFFLLFYLKYPIQKIFFSNYNPQKFYKNWFNYHHKFLNIIIDIYMMIYLAIIIFSATILVIPNLSNEDFMILIIGILIAEIWAAAVIIPSTIREFREKPLTEKELNEKENEKKGDSIFINPFI